MIKKQIEKKKEELHAAILNQDFGNVIDILDEGVVTLRDKITITSNTALHVAVSIGKNREFLEKMLNLAVQDNQPSFDMRNSEGSTLLHVAAIVGNTEAAKMLVKRNQDLLYEKDNEGQTPVDRALSNMHTDTYIYLLDEYLKTKDLEKDALFDSSEILVNAISSKDYVSAKKMIRFSMGSPRDPDTVLTAIAQNFPPNVNFLERRMMHLFSHVPVTFKFVEATQRKAKAYSDAILLLDFTCNLIRMSTNYNNAIFEATRQNAVEFVKIIVSRFPNAIWTSNEDGHNIIQHAVINRSEKEVERFVCPLNVIPKNSFGETPQMVFTKEHKKLLIEGQKWMKETAQSFTITATLITTIMFAAAITVPGGNKQDNGIPMFTNISLFTLFAVSDVISFFTSVASLLMFLSIVTDSFTEQDFLFWLPSKLIIGLVSLSISTIAMLVAFSASFVLVFGQNSSWIFAPVVTLIVLPFTFFMTLQFALVKNLISATYGRSMFGKKSNDPFY
ncbi:hypothetical protein E3N88_09635 [Mikania micrantha]|uniref:PGG domain-containing protein n=1 Tax=Mikania micrantha TaxID=192012 RepID=A0A5N6PJL0_9ASTR|nr:hypothetical protein E3N88_09635 [Mikania micrantha]